MHPAEALVALLLLAMTEAALMIPALKLRKGEWLRYISGNLHAGDQELKRPYQRQQGKDVARLLFACAAILPALVLAGILAEAGTVSAEAPIALTAIAAGASMLSCLAISRRANRARRDEDRSQGLPGQSKGDEKASRTQMAIILGAACFMVAPSLIAVLHAA